MQGRAPSGNLEARYRLARVNNLVFFADSRGEFSANEIGDSSLNVEKDRQSIIIF